MSTMVEHARRELALVGEEPGMTANLVAVVAAFASFGHSGGSAECALDVLERLLRRQALTPLTADPAEWDDRTEMSGIPMWQNVRDSRAISQDGGRTYILVDAPEGEDVTHLAAAPPWWLEPLMKSMTSGQAEAAVWAYLDAGPISAAELGELAWHSDEEQREQFMRSRWGSGAPVAALLAAGQYDSAPALV